MEPIYVDLHIHTSDDANNLSSDYDLKTLINKINEVSGNSKYLISLTDHNTVNKSAYLKAKTEVDNLLVGAELHIRNYDDAPPYHCHIYFDIKDIKEEIIDEINSKLNILYPNKVISPGDDIPTIEKIIRVFDSLEFLLLPHGGQSHSTFDKSIPDGVIFDSTIERSIYYNQFDGFTARSNIGLGKTIEYFKKLGINDFVNLITCTDNYNPLKYPEAKSSTASDFIPTWMFSLPTFEGLRLSLSESSRLVYSLTKPVTWSEYIKKAVLKNANIDLEVELTPGLNVVIGGSSSGKTLFVDSLYRKIINDFNESKYTSYNVSNLKVENISGIKPHYIEQNYIMKVISSDGSDLSINKIEIIKNVFPDDKTTRAKIDKGLKYLRTDLKELINSIKGIEYYENQLSRIPVLSNLITTEKPQKNIISLLVPTKTDLSLINFQKEKYDEYIITLNEIDSFLKDNPFIVHNIRLIPDLIKELDRTLIYSESEQKIRKIILKEKKKEDDRLKTEDNELQSKKQNFEKLLELITSYSKLLIKFSETLKKISEYSIKYETQEVVSMGHKLFIENNFELNKEKFMEVINHFLKTDSKIDNFKSITPQSLFEKNFKKQTPKVKDYDDFESKIYNGFESLNNKSYKIITKDGKKFESLSAGWKTSVILDIILGYDDDLAPLIIDQPEDNLATDYINKGLIKAVKQIKAKKQIILVSHNATIPMLGDAQNIIICKNEGGKINIKSDRLEGNIGGKSIVDNIAEITDGGKSSIKKRVKKYNLKKFKE